MRYGRPFCLFLSHLLPPLDLSFPFRAPPYLGVRSFYPPLYRRVRRVANHVSLHIYCNLFPLPLIHYRFVLDNYSFSKEQLAYIDIFKTILERDVQLFCIFHTHSSYLSSHH